MTEDVRSSVALSGIPETMLWTLYNRASEARRPDTFLPDPACVRIFDSIDYDFAKSFGKPDTSHPMRSMLVDELLRPWLRDHPGGTVVELGSGLETEFQRCDDGQVRWICVDVASALEVRRRFLPPTERCRYVAADALDLRWMDVVDPDRGVFVTAQGLFMYFTDTDVARLVAAIAERFSGCELVFDTIPTWFSSRTTRPGSGYGKTRDYQAPPMPWGVSRTRVAALLHNWTPRVGTVETQPYGFARGPGRILVWLCRLPTPLRAISPALVHVTMR